ncbi:hypothetical protein CEXT_275091 [Caerostris extrusa]|uniref:Uncharacterized protein n=1 Tax=Caerostris extrusa TaxID=172846 RepID=A0AAV4STD5_CAEEX|nr:hypothetical protein CEXT_275091 [Caerostris extrusa]
MARNLAVKLIVINGQSLSRVAGFRTVKFRHCKEPEDRGRGRDVADSASVLTRCRLNDSKIKKAPVWCSGHGAFTIFSIFSLQESLSLSLYFK